MGGIFISYRRSDSQGEAGRLFDELVKEFGGDRVFMDVAGIDAGRDFRRAIDDSVSSCSVLLAMIGPEWLDAMDEQGSRRLDDSNDYVRLEIAAALRRDIPVVPVLLRGAQMPRSESLPEGLADLSYRNAVEITHKRWKSDSQLLVRALRPLMHPGCRDERSSDALPLGEALVQRVARELAIYIGPIANIVVQRAAMHSSSPDELYQRVSAEIESESDRRKFVAALRR